MPAEITGILLAGGRGRRMGGLDKGLIPYRGQPLVVQVIERLRPQVGRLILSANRNLEAYRALGFPVVMDGVAGFQGPLAGILAAGRQASSDWLLVCPCDTPLLPLDLGARLRAAAEQRVVSVALAHDGERYQQICLLLRRALLPGLEDWLQRGERRVMGWVESQDWTAVDFSDQPGAFRNLNEL
jgi:molybdenum cofactor guanylyltransferase